LTNQTDEETDTSSGDNRDIIRSAVFLYDGVKYGTQLTDRGIRWRRLSGTGHIHFVSYDSMIGVKLVAAEKADKFVVFYCLRVAPSATQRTRGFCIFASLRGEAEAREWVQLIRAKIHNLPLDQIPPRRRMVVFINPFGGTKSAVQMWNDVSVMFRIADIDVIKVETQYRGHAFEVASKLDLETARDGIICVGGDGTMNEVINGLLSRADWDVVRRIPLGIIPGGSGNGLAWSLGAVDAVTAAFFIIKGKTRPMDLFVVMRGDGRLTYGFLSVSWAITSAVDFDSEVIRWMGSLRFNVWAVKEILSAHTYSGILAFVHDAAYTEQCRTECTSKCTVCVKTLNVSAPSPPTVRTPCPPMPMRPYRQRFR
jgi:hypothetical protein